MKIVIDARTLGSKPSGIGIYTFNYIKEIHKSEHALVLLTDVATSDEMKYLRDQGIEIISYNTSTYRSVQVLNYFAFVREQLNRIQPELFWEPNILIPRKMNGYNGRIMITIHDMFPVTHMKYFGWKYGTYFRYVLKRTIKTADIILYDSLETKEAAERFCPAVKDRKTFVQYVIVPRVDEEQQENEVSHLADEVIGKDYFLYVGNMEKRKGVDLLLEAYESYRSKGGSKALILAGKNREKDVDEKIAFITKKYQDVIYYGYVSSADKRALYKNCACFIFPSMAEGFGICVPEAMHYYKPIIASNLGIFKEVAGDCICYFSLEGSRSAQVEGLSREMIEFDTEVDEGKYDEVMARYLPELLGEKLLEDLEEV